MKNDEVVQVEVQLDIENLNDIQTTFQGMAKDLDTVADKIEELVRLMAPQEESWVESMLSGVDGFNTLVDGMKNVESLSDSITKGMKKVADTNENFNIFKALMPDTTELTGKLFDPLKSGIDEYISAVKDVQPEVGSFAALFPKLSMALSDAGTKLKEVGSAIGTVFGSLGGKVSQIAESTAGWIANTAATVGNTVAQWAQVAATTAWKAICVAATAVTTAFGAAMNFLTSPIGLVVIGITALIAIIVLLVKNWDTVKAALISGLEAVKNAFSVAANWLNTNVIQPVVGFFTNAFNGISNFLQNVFAVDWTNQFGAFGNVLNAFFANVENIWNAVKNIFSGIVSFIKNVFAGDWGAAWDSIVSVFKGIWDYLVAIVKAPINAVIGMINGLVQGVVDGINLVIKALNTISFKIPDWVPEIGGQTFGFNLAMLTAPKIPYLARGAVLPANKPFLAMVGDQKHGTNVEAPLATIQEAVAMVMADMTGGMMAGFEATVGVLKEILEAIYGIEIGDDVIGQAVARYNTKMAIMRGGNV